MSDRELLELAANAAGLKIVRWAPEDYPIVEEDGRTYGWNPREFDSDALRLAVTLHMTVRCYMGNACAQIGVPGQKNAYQDVTNRDDPMAATRLAITRAAAEIGRTTKD